jgi:signal transduction histidine kinase
MTIIKVLLITPSEAYLSEIKSLLTENREGQYVIERIEDLSGHLPKSDVALLDKDALPEQSIGFLAEANFKLSPRPVIFLVNAEPQNEADFRTVKSLTSEFLIKGNLSPAGLHNTIRYALETSSLKLQLEQQQRRYSSLFYNSVEPTFFLDEDLTIRGVNDAFFETFKISKRKALNKSFLDFIESDLKRNELERNIAALKIGRLDMKVRFAAQDSHMSFLGHLRLSPIRESAVQDGVLSNKVTAYHGTLTNISHEERLRAVKEKSRKIAMTYRLARTMAHEIRNPLTNVNLAVEQLMEETTGNENLSLYLEIIQRCTQRIDAILGQLLSTSEKQVFKRTNFDVIALIKEVVETIKDRSDLEDIDLTAEYDLQEAYLDGDREKIKIAFTNLLTNAIESMDKEAKTIKCRVSLDANYLRVDVEDNGAGMDQRQLESLFDPFFTSKSEGVGLGLTSTQTIISEHSGEIDVESEKGIGSTFSVYLPFS